MTVIDDKIRDEKLQYNINRGAANQHHLPEKLINMNNLQVKKYYFLIKNK